MHSIITPLLLITCAGISGITFIHCSWSLSVLLVCSALVLYTVWRIQAQHAAWIIASAMCIAFSIGAWRYTTLNNNYMQATKLIHTTPCTITGIVIDKTPGTFGTKKTYLTLALTSLTTPDTTTTYNPHSLFIVLVVPHTCLFDVDDIIRCTYTHKTQATTDSFASHLKRHAIIAYLFIQPHTLQLLDHPTHSCNRWLCSQRNTLIKTISHKVSPETYTLLSSLFFGRKDGDEKIYANTQHLFKLWGISHYLARSGLHVALFIMLLNALCMLLFLGHALKVIVMLCALAMYLFFSWPTLSFMRAVWMFALIHLYTFAYKRVKITHITLLVALATLLYNPFHLFFLDFQLTFFLTYLLGVLSEQRLFSKLLRP